MYVNIWLPYSKYLYAIPILASDTSDEEEEEKNEKKNRVHFPL